MRLRGRRLPSDRLRLRGRLFAHLFPAGFAGNCCISRSGLSDAGRADGGVLTCLSLLSPDPPQTLLFRLCLTSGDFAPVALLPGWCGAVTIAADSTIWAGVGEQLLHFPLDSVVPDVQLGEFGLIRFLSCQQSKLLISDPWAGRCLLMDTTPPYAPRQLYAGECGGCCFASCRKGTLPDWKASLNEP